MKIALQKWASRWANLLNMPSTSCASHFHLRRANHEIETFFLSAENNSTWLRRIVKGKRRRWKKCWWCNGERLWNVCQRDEFEFLLLACSLTCFGRCLSCFEFVWTKNFDWKLRKNLSVEFLHVLTNYLAEEGDKDLLNTNFKNKCF